LPGTVPVATATVRVAGEVLVTVGLIVGVSPASKEVATSETVPAKLSRGVRLIVDVPLVPAMIVRESGFADSVKSGPMTRISTDVECVRAGDELVPLMSTL
jgi:hypothetical protein